MWKAQWIVVLLFASLWSAKAQEKIPQTLKTRTEWVRLTSTSVVKFSRALEVTTGKPFRPLPKLQGRLLREFRLPSPSLSLRAPILVEYRVEATDWQETVGGNYRGSGRDENFAFLLRDEEGRWLPDRYGEVMTFGGLSVKRDVTADEPFSYWHPVTRWTHPTKPGKYELHCLAWDNSYTVLGRAAALSWGLPPGMRFDQHKGLVWDKTDEPIKNTELAIDFQHGPHLASPLKLPTELQAELKRRQRDTSELVTYGRFDVEIVDQPAKTAPVAGGQEAKVWPDNLAQALQTGLWYVPSKQLLPELRAKLPEAGTAELTGLALNPHPEAIELLLRGKPLDVLGAIHRLRTEHRPLLRPWLESLAESDDESCARGAYNYLRDWYQ